MMIINFFRYMRGYVWFEATGGFVERFLNLAARNRIPIWAGRKRGEVYTGCVAARDYRRLREHAKKTDVRLRVTQKEGVPFHRRRYRKRTGLLAGLCLFLAFILGMSLFIWRIEIEGNETVDDQVILQALEALEISPGSFRSSINVRDSERRMQLLVPGLSWVALNVEGSALHVIVKETVPPPMMVDPAKPCNIVAGEAGQIVSMNVYDGQTMLQAGDTVTPGDVIVSGITQDGRGQHLYRHSRAEVIAETLQVLEVAVPLEQMDYVETGKTVRRRYLGIFGGELPLFLPWPTPSPYHVEREEKSLHLFKTELPLSLLTEEYILMEEALVTLTEEEARQEAEKELENLQKARLGDAEILDRTLSGALVDGQYAMKAEVLCRMDIAEEREIRISPASALAWMN